ncbi:hypothetical protein MK280_14980, partial [Myxococcota bacterium]|nr:hypothetical protein [Myxococcota bacterium]
IDNLALSLAPNPELIQMRTRNDSDSLKTIGLDEAANVISDTAGYDIRPFADEYSRARLNRHLLHAQPTKDSSDAAHREVSRLSRKDVISALSLCVTTMFRDPCFFSALRSKVLGKLQHKRHLRIWQVGCATGEESYSLAITLNETGLTDRYTILATDFNGAATKTARRGKFDIKKAGEFTYNYYAADGQACFSDYYSATSDFLEMDPSLRRNIIFQEHDVTAEPASFRPDLVVCRNVMFYFSREKQVEILDRLSRSLRGDGFLCIGSKEPLPSHGPDFEMREISYGGRIFAVKSRVKTHTNS